MAMGRRRQYFETGLEFRACHWQISTGLAVLAGTVHLSVYIPQRVLRYGSYTLQPVRECYKHCSVGHAPCKLYLLMVLRCRNNSPPERKLTAVLWLVSHIITYLSMPLLCGVAHNSPLERATAMRCRI